MRTLAWFAMIGPKTTEKMSIKFSRIQRFPFLTIDLQVDYTQKKYLPGLLTTTNMLFVLHDTRNTRHKNKFQLHRVTVHISLGHAPFITERIFSTSEIWQESDTLFLLPFSDIWNALGYVCCADQMNFCCKYLRFSPIVFLISLKHAKLHSISRIEAFAIEAHRQGMPFADYILCICLVDLYLCLHFDHQSFDASFAQYFKPIYATGPGPIANTILW